MLLAQLERQFPRKRRFLHQEQMSACVENIITRKERNSEIYSCAEVVECSTAETHRILKASFMHFPISSARRSSVARFASSRRLGFAISLDETCLTYDGLSATKFNPSSVPFSSSSSKVGPIVLSLWWTVPSAESRLQWESVALYAFRRQLKRHT